MDKVSDALVSGLITILLERFLSTETYSLVVGKKLGPELVRRLRTALLSAEALVADAEQKQFGKQSVRKWLDDLRDAVYKAEDLLDRFCIKAATQKQDRTFLLSFFNFEERKMVNEIEEVVRTIEDLEKCKASLGLEKILTGSSSWRTPSSSLVRGNVHGREDDKKALIKMLNDNNEHHLSVIAIVGIGGVGKTTLAQWAYNNKEDFMEGFDLKAWVCVLENFDIIETTKNVLKGILGGTCSLDDFNSLQHALKEELSDKKFLIVLDDVWSDDADKWSTFMTPFQYGKKGSIVLLTTRGENVALAVHQDCRPYFLNGLSKDDCWSVFADNASFPHSNGNTELERIGRKIAEKCNGLPLAAETLGRLLRPKHEVKEWNKILMSDIWGFSVEKSKIIPALLISYFHLPAHLKRCFVYCSLYPKDYKFKKDELVLLWMAEDLLPLPKRGETLEEVGCESFDELTSRLFFTRQLQDDGDYFLMHDLLHDLAIFLAGDFHCNLEELGEEEQISIQTRHLHGCLCHCSSKLHNSISKVESLRTLLFESFYSPDFDTESLTCEIFSKCKYLRVLSFDKLDVLPNSIGELIHLRYLDLSSTNIKTLPESLCTLCSLQTLKLHGCSELTTLPIGLHNLVSLRHLDIRETSLEEMPGKMSKLNQLHILSSFVVGKHEDNGISELGGLVNLHGSLEIKKLENIADVKEARRAKIMHKKNLDELCLEWSTDDDMVSNTQTERDILDSLQPQNGLKGLRIEGYKGTTFPSWIGHCSYSNLTSVTLVCCNNCCMLPSLGQLPSLKSLRIQDFGQLQSIGDEFYKNDGADHSSLIAPFPSLESLEFHNMPCWEVWHSSDPEAFSQLKRLQIRGCPLLKKGVPDHIISRFVSLLSEVPQVRRLTVTEVHTGESQELSLSGNTLSIKGCESVVENAFKAMTINHLTYLQLITISDCSSVVSFPGNCLPKSLKWFRIHDCRQLVFPQQQRCDLVDLIITRSCDSLTSLSLDVFPNLESLTIDECKSLESISMSQPQEVALDGLFPNLTSFTVRCCSKLKALPCHMNNLFPNLGFLQIYGCPEIHALPEGRLPPNLKELLVGGCKQQCSCVSWMPGNFEALTRLEIRGDGCERVKSFPEVDSLPHLPSLTTLFLYNFPNLETLECNELLRLNALQNLEIEGCPKLENMTGEKLPPSLLQLNIYDCPLLTQRCKNKDQQLWPKISHIPTIDFGFYKFRRSLFVQSAALSFIAGAQKRK